MIPQATGRLPQTYGRADLTARGGGPANLADILERVLDKGIVIAGDIQVNLLDIELLTIKLRLLVCSVDRAQEMGINWWQTDSRLSGDAERLERRTASSGLASSGWSECWRAEPSRRRGERQARGG